MCIGKKKNNNKKIILQCLFFGSVLQYSIHVHELTQMSIKAPFWIGNNKETIHAKGSYPHVTVGLAVVVVNSLIGKNSKRKCEVLSCFSPLPGTQRDHVA